MLNDDPYPEELRQQVINALRAFDVAAVTAGANRVASLVGPRIEAATADAEAQYKLALEVGRVTYEYSLETANKAYTFGT